jgi:hypothetical protein
MKLEKSEALGREIRQERPEELAASTWEVVREAIGLGQRDQALAGLDYCRFETKMMHDSMCSFVDDAITALAAFGEEEIDALLRKRYEPVIRRWLSTTPGVEESLARCVEFQRGHGGECRITEEPDRYVVTCDPCGSGGQLRRTKQLATTARAYDWTWGRAGVPYYCTHCCVMWEILPIEARGVPIRLNLLGDTPEDPCVHLYYKRPELIPDEYYRRIGLSREPRSDTPAPRPAHPPLPGSPATPRSGSRSRSPARPA